MQPDSEILTSVVEGAMAAVGVAIALDLHITNSASRHAQDESAWSRG